RPMMRPRSGPGVAAQPGNALAAASTAAFASAAPLLGKSPSTSRVSAGFVHGSYLSVEGGTHAPPIRFWRLSSLLGMRMGMLYAGCPADSTRARGERPGMRRRGRFSFDAAAETGESARCGWGTRVLASARFFLLTQGVHVQRDLQALFPRPGDRPRHREHADLH